MGVLLYTIELMYVQDTIDETWSKLEEIRRDNYLMNILWSQQHRSTEFFSRWIELKEKNNALPSQGG